MSTPKNKVYVGNLSYKTEEDAIKNHFLNNVDGLEIVKTQVIMDRETGRPKGFCFIEFATDDQANSALELNGKDLDGRPLKVMIAEERKPREGGSRPRSGGGFGGKRDRDSSGFGNDRGYGDNKRSRYES